MSTHTSDGQKIQLDLNMQSGATEIIRLVATILFFGGIGCLAWAVADGGYAELAGTGVTVMGAQLLRQMWNKGVITAPKSSGEENFAESKALLARIADEYKVWMARSTVLRMVLVAFVYAVLFLVVRAGVVKGLTVFENIYIAGSVGAVIGAFVVAPSFLQTYLAPLKSKGYVNTEALKYQATTQAAPAPTQTADQPTVEPTTEPAPKVARQPVARPVSEPAAEPAAPAAPTQQPPKKVVRRVVKKAATDE